MSVTTQSATPATLPSGTALATFDAGGGALAGLVGVVDPAFPTRQISLNTNNEVKTHDADLLTALTDATAVSAVRAQQDSAGATSVILSIQGFTATGTTDVLATVLQSLSGYTTLATGLSSYQVTAGKVLRIAQARIWVEGQTGNTTAANVRARIRVNTAGAAVIGSPIVDPLVGAGISTTTGMSQPNIFTYPDGGLVIPSGAGIGISLHIPAWVVTTASPLVYVFLFGKEYTV